MAIRDKDALASCLEQQQKGEVRQDQCELHSQASSESSVTMEEAQPKKVDGTKEAQHKGQQVLDPTHDKRKQMDLELQEIKSEAEKDLMLSSTITPYVDDSTFETSLHLLYTSIRKVECLLISGSRFTTYIGVTAFQSSIKLLISSLRNLRHILMSDSGTTCYMDLTLITSALQLLRSELKKLRRTLRSDLTIMLDVDPTTLHKSLQLLDSSLEKLNEILLSGGTMTPFVYRSTLQLSLQLLSSSLETLRQTLMPGLGSSFPNSTSPPDVDSPIFQVSSHVLSPSHTLPITIPTVGEKRLIDWEPEDSGFGTKEICHSEGTENFYHTKTWKMEDFLKNFTQLLLLPKHCPRGWETLNRKSLHETKGEDRGYLIEIQDLFNPSPDTQEEPQLVILQGAAGIGKSTLARQVRRAWGEGQLYRDRFQHVFYFSCRELAQCKQLSLAELIAKDQTVPAAPIKKILSHPEKLLFILDGIDEPAWILEEKNPELCLHWSQKQPVHTLLSSLLGKTVLSGSFLLLTARTTDLKKFIPSFRQPCLIEVLGFSKSGRKKYIYKYFAKKREATKVFKLVETNPVLSALCVVPWVSWLVCTCLKQQMEQGGDLSLTSQTTTTLCLKYLSQTLPGHVLETHLRELCSLAAEGICRRKTLFSERDLQMQRLGKNVITTFLKTGILQKQPSSPCYSFAHLCLQEFFAAMSCILERMDIYRVVETLKEVYGRYGLFEAPTMRFLFGLLSQKGMRKMMKISSYRLPWKTRLYLQRYILDETLHHQLYSLGLLHCLYEMQDEDVLKEVIHNYQKTSVHNPVDMARLVFQTGVKYMVVQTDMDLMVVTFCIKFFHHVKRLQMNAGGQQRKISKAPRIVLSRWTPITNASWQVLFYMLEFTGNLKELDLSGNPLSYTALRSLCRTLRCPTCHLKTLWLVNCGLTSRHCEDLASVLQSSSSLTELDLQLNDLGDHGVRLLCEGLRNPACNLRILLLDQAPLSEQVMMKLRALEAENPQLLISSTWNPRVMDPTTKVDKEEMGDYLTSLKQQRLQLGHKHTEPLGTDDDFWGPTGPVATEVVDRKRNLYRVQFPVPGSYHCPNMGLCFVVTRAVSIDIGFCTWTQHLEKTPLKYSHIVAGPLFDIKAEQGAVAAVYLPHFLALPEEHMDIFLFRVAHFQEHGIVLEIPARVEQHYAVLKNPSFSPVGILVRMIPAFGHFIPITSITLIYYHLNLKEVTLHLYLIPNDCTIRKAIDEEEMKFQFLRINKPPPVDSLYIGSRYIVSASKKLEIIPKELELCYRGPRECQLFSEIHVDHMGSGIKLQIRDKKNKNLIWEALLKPGDLRPAPAMIAAALKDADARIHFVDHHREQLVKRVTSVDPLLDKLHSLVLSEEEYEAVRAEATNQDRMRKLFSLSRSWSWDNKDQVYRALKETHPYLIMDLYEKSGSVSVRS
ncbi:NACHT, LRR and PYD domains-containing protein 1a isoform X2 [Mesocricetus auratus]|nr:NACHT, LRR and PYD domains-containing protein 1a isoform X2 [Mesocricetus auratus]